MPDVHSLDDAVLISLWSRFEDHDNLTDYQREIIAEMEERGINF